jgi:hypothetical protein
MYQLIDQEIQGRKFVRRLSDMACIPEDPENSDYQRYLAWLAEGNVPLPA